MAALLKEKFQAEVTAANLAQTSTDTQTSLENKLTIADEALRAAESRSETLKTELNRVKADAAECVKRAERATAEGIEAAASATFAEARATAALAGKCPPAVCRVLFHVIVLGHGRSDPSFT